MMIEDAYLAGLDRTASWEPELENWETEYGQIGLVQVHLPALYLVSNHPLPLEVAPILEVT